VLRQSGLAPVTLNAANEIAVAGFLEERIPFLGIAAVVEDVLEEQPGGRVSDLEQIMEADRAARECARRHVERRGLS
jgi:1-deoxy-D-xylulose-5-phosphate reductoisomerase